MPPSIVRRLRLGPQPSARLQVDHNRVDGQRIPIARDGQIGGPGVPALKHREKCDRRRAGGGNVEPLLAVRAFTVGNYTGDPTSIEQNPSSCSAK